MWRGKANIKSGIFKIPGSLVITNRKIKFYSKSKNFEIHMDEIKNIRLKKRIIKRMEIEAGTGKFSFFIPGVENVMNLIEKFMEK